MGLTALRKVLLTSEKGYSKLASVCPFEQDSQWAGTGRRGRAVFSKPHVRFSQKS